MEDNKEEENLFPINLMVLKEHFWEAMMKYLDKIGNPHLLIDPELKLNIEYILHPIQQGSKMFSGISVLHENFEKEFESLKIDNIKTVAFIIKPWLLMVERA